MKLELDYDPRTGHILAFVGTNPLTVQEIDGQAVYAAARWLHHHDEGEPYEIIGEQGTFRITVEKTS